MIRTKMVAILVTLILVVPTHSNAALPSWIISKITGLIEDAVYDEINGFITQDGVSIASAGSVWMDYGTAVEAYWYADEFGNYHQTIQQNHLQGEEHISGGFELLDRSFSYHDWEVWDATGAGTLADPLELQGREQIAGNGFVVVVDNDDTWIGSGTVKHWDASYVIASDYSNTGGELLRRPSGDFNVKIEYKMADLDYSAQHGLRSTERDREDYRYARMSKIQAEKVTHFDLLEDNTEIIEGPAAYGKCKRIYQRILPDYSSKEWAGMIVLDTEKFFDAVINESEWGMYEFPIDYGWD